MENVKIMPKSNDPSCVRVYAKLTTIRANNSMLQFFKTLLASVCPPAGLSSITSIQGRAVVDIVRGVLSGNLEKGFTAVESCSSPRFIRDVENFIRKQKQDLKKDLNQHFLKPIKRKLNRSQADLHEQKTKLSKIIADKQRIVEDSQNFSKFGPFLSEGLRQKVQFELKQQIDKQRDEINQTSQKVARIEKDLNKQQTDYEAVQIVIHQATV